MTNTPGLSRLPGDQPNEEPEGYRYLGEDEAREYLAGHVSYSEAIETIDGVLVPEGDE